MTFLIDGHNLIGKMPGISLAELDDEIILMDLLEDYFKKIRKKAVIFFDHGNPLSSRKIPKAFVQARFVPRPADADSAIIQFLRSAGGAVRNHTVVSSDNAVARAAGKMGVKVMSCQEFLLNWTDKSKPHQEDQKPSNPDVEFWIKKFRGDS